MIALFLLWIQSLGENQQAGTSTWAGHFLLLWGNIGARLSLRDGSRGRGVSRHFGPLRSRGLCCFSVVRAAFLFFFLCSTCCHSLWCGTIRALMAMRSLWGGVPTHVQARCNRADISHYAPGVVPACQFPDSRSLSYSHLPAIATT